MSGTEHDDIVEQALSKLDLDAKTSILAGQNMWSLPAVPEIGLDSIVMSDGPIGVRGVRWDADDPCVALPSPTALAATWDVALARRVGNLLAQESRRKGVHVLLAPTVNLHRSPLGGRHFECYSEDPVLTGEIAAAYITGVQEGGVATTVKHFVANDFETERMTVDVLVGERALRELYLAPFETVVKKATPFGVMAAYNRVNGPTMTEHEEVDESVVDDHARRVLKLAARVNALDGARRDESFAAIDGDALAREVAARSFTLVRNSGVLPFGPDTNVALIGGAAKDARVMGGGSAEVYPDHTVSPYEGLDGQVQVTYARGADPGDRIAPARFPLRVTCRARDGRVLGDFPLREGKLWWLGELPGDIDLKELHTVEMGGTFTPEVGGVHRFSIEGVGLQTAP